MESPKQGRLQLSNTRVKSDSHSEYFIKNTT